MTDKVNCPICIKTIIDLAFMVEGRSSPKPVEKAVRECARCFKRWTLTGEYEPKIQPAPPTPTPPRR